jgi:hypothetical protein
MPAPARPAPGLAGAEITLMGYYTSVSMTLAFYNVPAGAPGITR